MAFGPGSIAFVGFNADGSDSLSFVVLEPVLAGDVINFTDNAWNGSAFFATENHWSWTATGDIAVGTVVTMDNLKNEVPTSNHGTVAYSTAKAHDLANLTESVFAYVGDPSSPTFLAAISNNNFSNATAPGGPGVLANTGLVEGVTAINLALVDAGADIAVYNGPHVVPSFADLPAVINNPSNWNTQDTIADDSNNGTGPEAPFPTEPFTADPSMQQVGFSSDSLAVSHVEGDAGVVTVFTFTVERINGTTGEVSFSGIVTPGANANAADFGGTVPLTFSGTIAEGATTGTVTITVSGDFTKEAAETFQLTLTAASNSEEPVFITDQTQATGTIVNDDMQDQTPLSAGSIAFTGFNADGNDNLSFVVLEDIAAGTVITFTDNAWGGSSFYATENHWTWTATSDIAAGTVVTMDDLATASASSNYGSIAYLTTAATRDIATGTESVFAYIGDASSPTFLAAISNNTFAGLSSSGVLTNTGLVKGVTAIDLGPLGAQADTAAYVGPRGGFVDFSDFLAAINDPANWVAQDSADNDSNDGVGPDVPFSTTPFEADPTAQQVSFAADSVTVSKAEGDAGTTTTFTFTVQRLNGTTGEVSFSGTVTGADAADFGGTLPLTFSGTIADGAATGTVSITVSGDITLESDEAFQLLLTSASNAENPAYLVGQTQATGTIVNDDTLFQTISWQAEVGDVVTHVEGEGGASMTYTFTVIRDSADGNLTFTARVLLSGDADAGDFGGAMEFSGQFLDGQTSTTISITVTGDDVLEGNEVFYLALNAGVTDEGVAVVPGAPTTVTGSIVNDDFVVHDGETVRPTATLTGDDHLLVEHGGTLTGASWPITLSGENLDVVIDNHGEMGSTNGLIRFFDDASGNLTINNHVGGLTRGDLFTLGATAIDSVVINNDGVIDGMGNEINALGAVVNNSSTGVIRSDALQEGTTLTASVVNNYGQIFSGSQDALRAGTVHNYAGGLIEGAGHAVTGGVRNLINEAGATMYGRGGSAVNVDNGPGVEDTVYVTNHGIMKGGTLGAPGGSDGDAVDIDGLLVLVNDGFIGGMAHAARHDGEPNVSEGIAIGGGSITNNEGGEIYGYGRAIQVDNSGNASAFATATIVNHGLIHGDGNMPEKAGLTPEEEAFFRERLTGGEAINIEGSLADSLTNGVTGQIIGGVKMGGGDDVLVNSGSMSATGGSAIDMGDGNDTVTLEESANILGAILLGSGNDRLTAAPDVQIDLEIDAGAGDDVVVAALGDDVIEAALGDDVVDGRSGDDEIDGGEGNDTLDGGEGDDTLLGGKGSDVLKGGTGDDTLDGGEGVDTADYSADTAGVTVDLSAGEAFGDDAGEDTLENIENVTGGAGNDQLVGNGANNVLIGGLGDDVFVAGAGFDRLDGGAGVDTADYSGENEGIYVRLDQDWATVQSNRLPNWADFAAGINGNTIEHDDLVGIENITGTAYNDAIVGDAGDNVIRGGAGNDQISGLGGNDTLEGGEGNDRIAAGAGDVIRGGAGNDAIDVTVAGGAPASIDGGADVDTVRLSGTGTGALGAATNVENLVVQSGAWSIAGEASGYSDIVVEGGATVTSTISLDDGDRLVVEAGGRVASGTTHGLIWRGGDVTVDNYGTIEAKDSSLSAFRGQGTSGSVTFTNHEGGQVKHLFYVVGNVSADSSFTLTNAGTMAQVQLRPGLAQVTFDNLETGFITEENAGRDLVRIGGNSVFTNAGRIVSTADSDRTGGDAVVYDEGPSVSITNRSTGYIEASRHAVTGESAATIVNEGTLIGRNGSAVNIDNDGGEENRVTVTNRGTMEGRSAEYADSDGDAIDVDGLLTLHNYGRVAGMSAEGYHNGEPNVSEGLAVGGGEIYNYQGGEIYGYGRGIQVDNSSNENALGATTIVNEGLIQGDGHGPEGVDPEDAAQFDLRGNEAINLVGSYADLFVNTRTGTIIGGVAMGGGNDQLSNLGAMMAIGGSAIDMGDGNDGVALHDDATVSGDILLGAGNDVLSSSSLSDLVIYGGDGQDSIGTGAGDDRIYGGAGLDLIASGAGDDTLDGGEGNDTLNGFEGDDTLIGGAGIDTLIGGAGDDAIEAAAGDIVTGGEGDDTITVAGGTEGATSVDGGTGSDYITVLAEGSIGSTVNVDESDHVTVEAGGEIRVTGNAFYWTGGGNAVIENAGLIEASGSILDTKADSTGDLTFNNLEGGVVRGAFDPSQEVTPDSVITINNSGIMEADGRVIDFSELAKDGAQIVINNLEGGIIRQYGSDTDVIRPGENTTVNNWGTITTGEGFVGEGDLIDFQGDRGGRVNNRADGVMEGSRHVVTGDHAVTVLNEGTMIGRNGSAVNIDNDGSEDDRVNVINRGTMEGRSAELADSDGDAIDVDGLLTLQNYGRIAGMGAEGYHDGEPNVSEGLAIGGGTIVNNAGAEIYGYGRGIQVDNSSNENALGATLVVNDGLIQGDGHGPEGVNPEDAAQFDLRGNEAINLVGNYADEIINNSAGRIVGGVSMGGGNDRLSNSGLISATGGSAIDMGAGDDVVNLYIGANVEGTILLGEGNDRLTMNSNLGAVTVDAGDGNDDITTSFGDDVIHGGAGNDYIFAETGNDTIFGDDGDDTFLADLGNDRIDGGEGFDTLFLARATGPVTIDFVAGRVSGAGIGTDTFTSIENVLFGAGNDTVNGANGNDVIDGGDGNDTLSARAGDDTLAGGNGDDTLDGGSGNDAISGGTGSDIVVAGSGNDEIDGGEGDDLIDAGSGNDVIVAGMGNDVVEGGSNDDRIEGGAGNDTLSGNSGHDSFVFAAGFGHDKILDFQTLGSSADALEFDADIFADFGAAMDAATQVGHDVVFAVDANNTLTLEGMQLGSLQADDFRFV